MNSSNKKERLRFSTEDDLSLLWEVLCHYPHNDARQWSIIQKIIILWSNKPFTLRAIKEHVEYLLKIWAKEDRVNFKK